MIITDNTKCKQFPMGLKTKSQKTHWLSNGIVTVVRCGKVEEHDIVYFYLPRIRGMNFKYKNCDTGASTPGEAYQYGLLLKRKFKTECHHKHQLAKHRDEVK